jgi:hypothetical protein
VAVHRDRPLEEVDELPGAGGVEVTDRAGLLAQR